MVDFTKKVTQKPKSPDDPILLYDTLDRASDKGPLRPAQLAVLGEWHNKHRANKDLILKLHTGQGKTLVGLLMLQAALNREDKSVIYLCPNNFLVQQTVGQAESFGIPVCVTEDDGDLPDEFHNGKKIYVTTVQKLFNGRTKFGLGANSINIGTILMDDSHACSDAIREGLRIRLDKSHPAYADLMALFRDSLASQGEGTFADIENSYKHAFLPVPYWDWLEKIADVAKILARHASTNEIKFAWPVLRDELAECICTVSGEAIEIEPPLAPLDRFGSYSNADHRIFMSATVTDDAFLIKGLNLSPDTIAHPLTYDAETWSGEKMILLPSLIDSSLDRQAVVSRFAKPNDKRKYGLVALVPSEARTRDWKTLGADIANGSNIEQKIQGLRDNDVANSLVIVNRYDGIDLPDSSCRILIIDSVPFSENLFDLYQSSCRPDSETTYVRTVRTIEQGMGRSVRGEKDYSVVVVTGSDLTRLLREKKSRKYLSAQLSTQIEIGLDIADMAKEDISKGTEPVEAFEALIRQLISRDAGWKAFYQERMDAVKPKSSDKDLLQKYVIEREAETLSRAGKHRDACGTIQVYLDMHPNNNDKSWYLQEMARYLYRADKVESGKLQITAYTTNRDLLRPLNGVVTEKITVVSHGRIDRIIEWAKSKGDADQLHLAVADICGKLAFGVIAEKFEFALNELAVALGFVGSRPDKHEKQGPDNLWALDDKNYVLWECKSEVDADRAEIHKSEAEQMNRSSAWFYKVYKTNQVRRVLIHPTHKLSKSGAFTHEVWVVRPKELSNLVKDVRTFFSAFSSMDFNSLSQTKIQQLLDLNHLSTERFMSIGVSVKELS